MAEPGAGCGGALPAAYVNRLQVGRHFNHLGEGSKVRTKSERGDSSGEETGSILTVHLCDNGSSGEEAVHWQYTGTLPVYWCVYTSSGEEAVSRLWYPSHPPTWTGSRAPKVCENDPSACFFSSRSHSLRACTAAVHT